LFVFRLLPAARRWASGIGIKDCPPAPVHSQTRVLLLCKNMPRPAARARSAGKWPRAGPSAPGPYNYCENNPGNGNAPSQPADETETDRRTDGQTDRQIERDKLAVVVIAEQSECVCGRPAVSCAVDGWGRSCAQLIDGRRRAERRQAEFLDPRGTPSGSPARRQVVAARPADGPVAHDANDIGHRRRSSWLLAAAVAAALGRALRRRLVIAIRIFMGRGARDVNKSLMRAR
jgi:hypothetical protein